MRSYVRARLARAIFVAAVLFAPAAAGSDVRGVPLPEPIFNETVSDIDGIDSDVEVEVNGAMLRALVGGDVRVAAALEAEWLLARKVGFRLECRVGSDAQPVSGSAGVSWKLLQDFRHDRYVQAELVAHTLGRLDVAEAGESPLPLSLALHGAQRVGLLTLRAAIGVSAGAATPQVPLRGSLAIMTGFARSLRYGFWGIEADVDGSRPSPFTVALDLIPNLAGLGLPVRVGFAIPWNIGADGTKPSVGLYVRVFFESEREVEYGRTGR